MSLILFVFWLIWVDFDSLRFCTSLSVRDEHVVGKTKVSHAVSFFITQFDAQALFVRSFNVFLRC